MNVALLHFELDSWDFWGDTLGPQYLAAELRHAGHEVNIFSVPMSLDKGLVEKITAFNPLLVGFSLPCPFEKRLSVLGRELAEKLPAAHITCGNRFASDNSQYLLEKYSWLDSVIRGEGEYTIVELADCLVNNRSLENCRGLYFKHDSRIVRNPDRDLIADLNKMQFPARDILIGMPKEKNATFISGRGCVNNCSFCNSSYTDTQKGKVWRGRTPENVVDELEQISKLGYRNFFFADPSYEEPGKQGKQRIREIAEKIIERGLDINYGVYFSAHRWTWDDMPLLELLRQSGLEYVYVGIESGTPESLKLFNKRATVDDNYRMLSLLKEAGTGIKFGFIMFHPYLSLEEMKRNIEFVHKTQIGYSFRCYTNELEVYKGTEIYELLNRDGLLTGETDSETGNYMWSYKDSNVSFIRELTKQIVSENECIQKEIGLEYKVVSFINRLKNKAIKQNRFTDKALEYNNLLEELYGRMNDLNYRFMSQTIALVEQGFDRSIYDEIQKGYIASMGEMVKKLEEDILLFSFKAKKMNLL